MAQEAGGGFSGGRSGYDIEIGRYGQRWSRGKGEGRGS